MTNQQITAKAEQYVALERALRAAERVLKAAVAAAPVSEKREVYCTGPLAVAAEQAERQLAEFEDELFEISYRDRSKESAVRAVCSLANRMSRPARRPRRAA